MRGGRSVNVARQIRISRSVEQGVRVEAHHRCWGVGQVHPGGRLAFRDARGVAAVRPCVQPILHNLRGFQASNMAAQ